MNYKMISTTPVMATAASYATGDQVGLVNTLTDALDSDAATVMLETIIVKDKGNAKAAGELWFFNQSPTLTNTDSGAFGFADTQLAKCLGWVPVAAADYASASDGSLTSAIAVVKNIGMMLKGAPKSAASGVSPRNLYCVFVTRGSPTYADGDLTIVVGLSEL